MPFDSMEVADEKMVFCDGAIGNYINPKAFVAPAPGTYGKVGLGTVVGPGSLNFNAGVSRLFRVREHQTIELRMESQNVLNTANFSNPSSSMTSNTFGQINSAGPARIIQFAFKYIF